MRNFGVELIAGFAAWTGPRGTTAPDQPAPFALIKTSPLALESPPRQQHCHAPMFAQGAEVE